MAEDQLKISWIDSVITLGWNEAEQARQVSTSTLVNHARHVMKPDKQKYERETANQSRSSRTGCSGGSKSYELIILI